jgi:hypothetical protein
VIVSLVGRGTQMRNTTHWGWMFTGLAVTTLAHAAPTPPGRAGFGPGPGGTDLHFEGPYDDDACEG